MSHKSLSPSCSSSDLGERMPGSPFSTAPPSPSPLSLHSTLTASTYATARPEAYSSSSSSCTSDTSPDTSHTEHQHAPESYAPESYAMDSPDADDLLTPRAQQPTSTLASRRRKGSVPPVMLVGPETLYADYFGSLTGRRPSTGLLHLEIDDAPSSDEDPAFDAKIRTHNAPVPEHIVRPALESHFSSDDTDENSSSSGCDSSTSHEPAAHMGFFRSRALGNKSSFMSLRAAAARTDSQVLDSDVSVSHETESSKAKSSIESTSTASQSGFRYTSRAFHNASRRAFFLRPGSIRPRNLPAPLAASEVIHAPPGKSPRSKADTSYHRRARSDDPVRSILSQLDDAPQVPEDSAGAVLARTLQARRECAADTTLLGGAALRTECDCCEAHGLWIFVPSRQLLCRSCLTLALGALGSPVATASPRSSPTPASIARLLNELPPSGLEALLVAAARASKQPKQSLPLEQEVSRVPPSPLRRVRSGERLGSRLFRRALGGHGHLASSASTTGDARAAALRTSRSIASLRGVEPPPSAPPTINTFRDIIAAPHAHPAALYVGQLRLAPILDSWGCGRPQAAVDPLLLCTACPPSRDDARGAVVPASQAQQHAQAAHALFGESPRPAPVPPPRRESVCSGEVSPNAGRPAGPPTRLPRRVSSLPALKVLANAMHPAAHTAALATVRAGAAVPTMASGLVAVSPRGTSLLRLHDAVSPTKASPQTPRSPLSPYRLPRLSTHGRTRPPPPLDLVQVAAKSAKHGGRPSGQPQSARLPQSCALDRSPRFASDLGRSPRPVKQDLTRKPSAGSVAGSMRTPRPLNPDPSWAPPRWEHWTPEPAWQSAAPAPLLFH